MNPFYENIERTMLYLPFFLLASGALLAMFELAVIGNIKTKLSGVYMTIFFISLAAGVSALVYSLTGAPCFGNVYFKPYFFALILAGFVPLAAAIRRVEDTEIIILVFFAAVCALASVFSSGMLVLSALFGSVTFLFSAASRSGYGAEQKKAFYILAALGASFAYDAGFAPRAAAGAAVVFLTFGSTAGISVFQGAVQGKKNMHNSFFTVISVSFELMILALMISSVKGGINAYAAAAAVLPLLAGAIFNNITEEWYVYFITKGFLSLFFLFIFYISVCGGGLTALGPVIAVMLAGAYAVFIMDPETAHLTVSTAKHDTGTLTNGVVMLLIISGILCCEIYIFYMMFRAFGSILPAAELLCAVVSAGYMVNFFNNVLIMAAMAGGNFRAGLIKKIFSDPALAGIVFITAAIAAVIFKAGMK